MTKVMLVEDDNNLREIYEARMQAEGYDVVSAKDGEEALVVAKAEKPELIISDVMMPKISGFEMLDILRNTDGLKDVKVIMLTALGQTDDQQRADRLGADRYLVKSQVTLEDIVNVAHQLLGDVPAEAAPAAEPAVAMAPAPTPEPVAAPAAIAPTPAAEPVTVAVESVAVAPVPAAPEPVAIPVTPSEPVATTPAISSGGFSAVQVDPPADPVTAPENIISPTGSGEATSVTPTAGITESPKAQSSAQEQAVVDAQIEDFVAGASSDAPAPAPAAQPSMTTPATNADADDKMMAEAVDTLMASTPAQEQVAPNPAPIAMTATNDDSSTSQPVTPTIAGKKIITPTASADNKPDIQELLAKEEAKNTDVQASSEPTPNADAVSPSPSPVAPLAEPVTAAPAVESAPAQPPADPDKPDLSSIAL
ncbi:MAG: response regulator [Candidatus Saccharimonadales bacterium]